MPVYGGQNATLDFTQMKTIVDKEDVEFEVNMSLHQEL